MGKRSNYERKDRDFYPTPYEAVVPLLPHLIGETRFCEPCAGAGDLVDHLTSRGHICARARDIEPQREDIDKKDALTTLTGNIDCFITNPPWSRPFLHDLIAFLSAQHPTWLLFDSDWMHTKQSIPYMPWCKAIVSVGRVSWMQNGNSGMDNCCWYLFSQNAEILDFPIKFYGRQPSEETGQ